MPAALTLSFGYDTERPHGRWALGERGRRIRTRQWGAVRNISRLLDELEAPRTFFLLGDYLESCADSLPLESIREFYDCGNPLVDIQQHSYSHIPVRPTPGQPGDPVATPEEFGADLRRANDVIQEIVGRRPTGLRVPRGHPEDLSSLPRIVEEIDAAGLNFVSSDLRGPARPGTQNLEGPMSPARQPHTYASIGFHHIAELPSHGNQDVLFTEAGSRRWLGRPPVQGPGIVDHYLDLLDEARGLGRSGEAVHVCLCLHPFAVAEWDPDMELHRELITEARDRDVEVVSYRTLADRVLGKGGQGE